MFVKDSVNLHLESSASERAQEQAEVGFMYIPARKTLNEKEARLRISLC